MPDLDFTRIEPPEKKRTYLFANGQVSFENVVAVCIRPSGSHRLELADGRKIIVAANWLAIELEIGSWTF